jgi:hypothetical protein
VLAPLVVPPVPHDEQPLLPLEFLKVSTPQAVHDDQVPPNPAAHMQEVCPVWPLVVPPVPQPKHDDPDRYWLTGQDRIVQDGQVPVKPRPVAHTQEVCPVQPLVVPPVPHDEQPLLPLEFLKVSTPQVEQPTVGDDQVPPNPAAHMQEV